MMINAADFQTKDILKFVREWSGMTQKELTKLVGVSEKTIQNYEQGYRSITFEMFINICKKISVEISIKKIK